MRARSSQPVASPRGRIVAAIVACALLPAVAVVELVAVAVQAARVPTMASWHAAAAAAVAAKGSGDVIVIAPRWATPIGDMVVGRGDDAKVKPHPSASGDPVDVRVAARSDLETAPHVVEISLENRDDPQLKGWKLARTERFGALSLRLFDNPHPQTLLRDLTDEIDSRATVYRAHPGGAHDACRWEGNGAQRMPALATGPNPSAQRFLCPPFDIGWSAVGPTVITDLDYTPRRCVLMHPDRDTKTTIELPAGPIGDRIVAYVGLHVFSERELKFAPVHARVSVEGKVVAETTHFDGDGWKRFEGDTHAFAGTDQPIKLEIWSEDGHSEQRMACLDVQVRK